MEVIRVNTLKIKPKGTYILGICDCGFSRRFELVKDFEIPYEAFKSYPLNETFCCPNCFKKYDYINGLQQGYIFKGLLAYGMILFFVFLILGYPFVKGVIKE